MAKKPTEDKIREAAYHLWEKEGHPEGQDDDLWYRAEKDLKKPAPRKKAAAKTPATKAAAKAPATKSAAKKPAAKKPAAKKTTK